MKLNAIGSFGPIPDHEIGKVVIQFRPPQPDAVAGPVKLIFPAPTGSGVLWLLGMNAFAHLFPDSPRLMDLLDEILFGDRDFTKTIPDQLHPFLTPLQNTQKGIKAQLATFSVLESADYLLLADAQLNGVEGVSAAQRRARDVGLDLNDLYLPPLPGQGQNQRRTSRFQLAIPRAPLAPASSTGPVAPAPAPYASNRGRGRGRGNVSERSQSSSLSKRARK